MSFFRHAYAGLSRPFSVVQWRSRQRYLHTAESVIVQNIRLIAPMLISQRFSEAYRAEASGEFGCPVEVYQDILKADGRNVAAKSWNGRVSSPSPATCGSLRIALPRLSSLTSPMPSLPGAPLQFLLGSTGPTSALAAIGPFVGRSRARKTCNINSWNHVKKAERVACALVDLAPTDPVVLFSMGRLPDVAAWRAEAIECYMRSIETGRALAIAYLSHAWAQMFSERLDHFDELLVHRSSLGLEWNERCLNFQEHDGLVLTPRRLCRRGGVIHGRRNSVSRPGSIRPQVGGVIRRRRGNMIDAVD